MNKRIKDQILELLSSEDPNIRRQAAEDLSSSNAFSVIAALAAAMRDENTGVRDSAVRSLLSIGGSNVPRVIVEYITDQNIITRNLAGDILLKCGANSINPLLPYLQDVSRDVRKFAVDILGLIKSKESVPYILPLLVDSDENVVISAVEALGNIGSSEAIPELTKTFERYEYARVIVAEALGKIGDTSAAEFLQLKLYWAIKDRQTDPLTLFAMVEALAEIGNLDAFTLLQTCFDTFHGKLRSVTLHSLSRIAERYNIVLPVKKEWKSDIIRALHDDDLAIKKSAINCLVVFKDSETTQALLQVLGVSPEIDKLLFNILQERKDIYQSSIEIMSHASDCKCKSLISLLGELAQKYLKSVMHNNKYFIDENILDKVFETVSSRFQAADEETRTVIIDTIFHLDGDRAIQFLDEIMKDPDPWIRIHIMELVAEVTDRRAPEFIGKFIRDEDPTVQEMAKAILQSKGLYVESTESDINDFEYVS